MFKKKVNENKLWGMPSVVDHQNQIVYLKCSSAITAMGIPAIVKEHYPDTPDLQVFQYILDNIFS